MVILIKKVSLLLLTLNGQKKQNTGYPFMFVLQNGNENFDKISIVTNIVYRYTLYLQMPVGLLFL